jgi:hypothetical protein
MDVVALVYFTHRKNTPRNPTDHGLWLKLNKSHNYQWCLSMWIRRSFFCLYRFGQCGQQNCGSIPHSCFMWRYKWVLCLYALPHLWHSKRPWLCSRCVRQKVSITGLTILGNKSLQIYPPSWEWRMFQCKSETRDRERIFFAHVI